MRRINTILGWVLIALIYFILNWITVDVGDGYRPVPTHPYTIPLAWCLIVAAIWYLINWIHAIKEWNRRPVLLLGRYVKTVGPGLAFVEPLFYQTLDDVPVQDVVVRVNAEHVQTKDNVGVGLDGLLTYRVAESKVKDAVVEVKDIASAVSQRGLSTLTDIAAATDIDHLLENRGAFCNQIAVTLRERVALWGVDIKAFELKGFKINDVDIEKSIAMKARAHKEAAAELTRATMQEQIATKLSEAAAALTEQGWRLKGIEVLTEISRGPGNTILVPNGILDALGSITKLLPKAEETGPKS